MNRLIRAETRRLLATRTGSVLLLAAALLGGGLMGDGIIDIPALRAQVEAGGYDGPIEVEILNPAIWELPREELMRTTVERFERCVF